MTTTGPDLLTTWRVICAHAWNDEDFKRELKRDPDGVLGRFNVPTPPGMHFAVVENEGNVLNLVLPRAPKALEGVAPAGDETVSQYNASCI